MWNAMARQKNSYLHATIRNVDAQVLNRCVDVALEKTPPCKHDGGPEFRQPTLLQPRCFGTKVWKKKASIGYGLWGLPILTRSMNSLDRKIQSEALFSLTDVLQNPLECFRAINDYDITKRLAETMDRVFPDRLEEPSDLERLLMNLGLVACHYTGALKLLQEHQLVSTLYAMIIDDKCASRYAATVLLQLSSQPHVSDLMARGDHLRRVLKVLSRVDEIEEVYLELANLIERSPAKAIDEGCFSFLLPRLECSNHLQPHVMKCFALLINCNDAQRKCDREDLVEILYSMISNDSLTLETLEYTVMALKNAMFSTQAMWRCREFWDLPIVLIKHAHCKQNDRLQLACLQTLRQLTGMPSMKNFVRKSCKKKIKNIHCRTKYVEKCRDDLLNWIRKKPYINIDSDYETAQDDIIAPEEKPNEPAEMKSEKCSRSPRNIAYRLDYKSVKNYNNVVSSSTSSPSTYSSDSDSI